MSAVETQAGVEQALALLGRLEESDRQWVLEHLPATAKARLVEAVGAGRAPWARLAACDAARVAEVLNAEPAWLVQAVLAAGHWPWKAEVVERLPATVRMEVDGMSRRGVTLARPAVEFLLRSLSERLEQTVLHDVHFDSLVLNFTREASR